VLDFAEAYLVACAETTEINKIAAFDRFIDRITTVERDGTAGPIVLLWTLISNQRAD